MPRVSSKVLPRHAAVVSDPKVLPCGDSNANSVSLAAYAVVLPPTSRTMKPNVATSFMLPRKAMFVAPILCLLRVNALYDDGFQS